VALRQVRLGDELYFSLRVIRIGGACGTHEKEEKWVQSVGGKSMTEGSRDNRKPVAYRGVVWGFKPPPPEIFRR